MNRIKRVHVLTLATLAMLCLSAQATFALTYDSAGMDEASSLGYTVYDIVVTKILNGPIGVVAGVAFIVLGALQAARNNLVGAVPAIIAGGVLIKAEDIVEGLGAII